MESSAAAVFAFTAGPTRAELSASFQTGEAAAYSRAGAIWVHQVHGIQIARWSAENSFDPSTFECDTQADGVTVDARVVADLADAPTPIVVTADCVPILWAASAAPIWGVVHASRKNLEDGILGALEREFADLDLAGAQVEAILGPAICGKCYEVGPDLADKWTAIDPQAITVSRTSRPALDLPGHVARTLEERGVRVFRFGDCTLHNPHWFSYRRDQTAQRNLSWIRKARRD